MQTERAGGVAAPLDLTGLTGRVSLGDVDDYDRRHGVGSGRRWWVIAIIVAIYLTGQAVLLAFLFPAFGLDPELSRGIYSGFLVFTGLYAAVMMGVIWRNAARPVRIERAARANGFGYDDRETRDVRLAGSVYRHPSFSFVTDVLSLRSDAGQVFAAATLAPRPGTSLRRRGLAVIALERETPHIVLENRRVGVLRTTGTRFHAHQHLRLEGDFDRTFRLSCPRGYETDALYIFTPDLMALMLDLAGDCEAELIDGDLVLYGRRPWRLWRPARFAALVGLVSAIGAKARWQTMRYEDPRRDGVHAIAAAGRRLRVRPSLGAVLATAAPIAFILFGFVSWLVRL